MAGLAQVNNIYVGQGGRKMAAPVLDRETYLAQRDTEDNKRNFHKARYGENEEEAKAAKMALKQYAYNSMLPNGVLRGACLPTGLFAHDIDIATDEEVAQHQYDDVKRRADEMVKQILERKDEIGLRELSRTPHFGLHLICEREMGRTILENQVRLSMLFHTEMDTNNKDYSRIMFAGPSVSEDGEELLYLDDRMFECPLTVEQSEKEFRVLKERQQNDMEDVPEGAKKRNKHYQPWLEDAEVQKVQEVLRSTQTQVEHEVQEASSDEKRGDSPITVPGTVIDKNVEISSYLGIPYDTIINKYWEMFYEGKTPVKSNRDTLTYELANVMKHICGFDRNVLAQVIPCYDGFSETEKMKCIDSALSGRRTQMPKRLREVLEALRRSELVKGNGNLLPSSGGGWEEATLQDELFYFNRMPKGVMVQGIKDSIDAAGHTLAMPVLTAICPAIGARATGVKLKVHGKVKNLNLIAFISGDFASGKGQMDDVVMAWMGEDIAMAEMYNQQWDEWAEKKKAAKNKKEQPEEPKFPKVWIPLNNTTANLAATIANVQGKHAFSFTPEADIVSAKWRSSIIEFSSMIRCAYDGSPYDREAKSVDAVNVHIKNLLWNVVLCGTPDALFRVVNNYTDGFQSRIAVARTPDNTFSPLEDTPALLSEVQKEKIEQVSHLLPLMTGTIDLPKLETQGRKWLEEIRLETMKNDDKTQARQRFRVCVTAQRMTCCLMLVGVCAKLIKEHGCSGAEKRLKQDAQLWQKMMERMQTPAFLEMFDIIADSLLDNNMYFFGDRIEEAFKARTYVSSSSLVSTKRSRRGKNDTIYSRLPEEFSLNEAQQYSRAIKGSGTSAESVTQMLKNWKNQGLIEVTEDGGYRKVS